MSLERAAPWPLATGAGALLLNSALGGACVLAFAPFGLYFVPLLSLTLLASLVERAAGARRAAALGLAFGLGYFLTGVSWIYVSLHDFGGMSMPLAAFATLFFCTYLSLFPAAAAGLTKAIPANPGVRLGVVFPAAWTAMEWARGWVFTGFPWLAVGYSQAPASPLVGYAPIVGAFGLSLIVAACAGLLAWWAPWARLRPQGWRMMLHPAVGLLVAVAGVGAGLQRVAWTVPAGERISVTLVQGNIKQDIKWRPEFVRESLDTYLKYTLASQSRLIVLPETALPLFNVDVPRDYLDLLARHARANDGDIVLGVPELVAGEPPRFYNSVMSYGTSPSQTYRKVHLVPFGDYFPRWGFISWIMNALDIPMSDFSRGEAYQQPMTVAGQEVAVNICYEDVFGEEIIRQLPKATLLANFTNDAWWGDSFASAQHTQMSQMRSLETGRYMLRATNTGLTAIIDERGRIRASAPQFVATVLHGTAQGFNGSTPYVRWGNLPFLALAAAGLAGPWAWARLRQRALN
jgi:apolipoprotein N-acyltransferase